MTFGIFIYVRYRNESKDSIHPKLGSCKRWPLVFLRLTQLAHMDLDNDACLQRSICQCTLSIYFSSMVLTISSTQAAVPSVPMQNLWPVLIREGSSTVAVLRGICYMLENRYFN